MWPYLVGGCPSPGDVRLSLWLRCSAPILVSNTRKYILVVVFTYSIAVRGKAVLCVAVLLWSDAGVNPQTREKNADMDLMQAFDGLSYI